MKEMITEDKQRTLDKFVETLQRQKETFKMKEQIEV